MVGRTHILPVLTFSQNQLRRIFMPNRLMESVMDFVRSINPTLLSSPPPAIETSGRDICFLGPSGDIDNEDAILCGDLAEGKRSQIASWYLSPERHLYEYVFVTVVSILILRSLLPALQHPTTNNKNSKAPIRPPYYLRVLSAVFCCLMMTYKIIGYPGKLFMCLMPCNVNWIMLFVLSYFPNLSLNASNIIIQLLIPLMGLAVVAVAEPDLSDMVLPFEIPYFFLHHTLLPMFPIYFLCTGKTTTLPLPQSNVSVIEHFLKWWFLSCTMFGFFFVTIVTPLSLYSGLNLNYMTSPPPGAEEAGVNGENYRLQSAGVCAFVFFIVRIVVTLIEAFVRFICKNPYVIQTELKFKENSKLK